jgi:hypothetical protein
MEMPGSATTTLQSIGAHRAEILELAARYGATNVRVFGSVARGEARPTSDIDLLITIDETRSLLDYIALMQDLEDLLGRRIDLVIEPDLHPAIRERVLAEALPV